LSFTIDLLLPVQIYLLREQVAHAWFNRRERRGRWW
jgi:hypothetical protein